MGYLLIADLGGVKKKQILNLKLIAALQKNLLEVSMDEGFKTFIGFMSNHFSKARPNAPFNPYEHILSHGRTFLSVKNPKKMMTPKMCHNNSFTAICENSKWQYVTGWALFRGVPIEHSWNLDDKGIAIDCTARTDMEYIGLVIPRYVLMMLVTHKSWEIAGTPIATMCNLSDEDLKEVRKHLT